MSNMRTMQDWQLRARPTSSDLAEKKAPDCREPKYAPRIWEPTKATRARELARSLSENLGAHTVRKEVNKLLSFSFDGLMNYVSGLESALSKSSRAGSFKRLVDNLYAVLQVVAKRAEQFGNKAQIILKRCQSIAQTLEEPIS